MRVELTKTKIDINTTSTSKHVPDIERQIRVTKYREKLCCHTIQLNHTPKVILVSMLMNCALCINAFPSEVGVSTSVIPHTILTGLTFDYNKHC